MKHLRLFEEHVLRHQFWVIAAADLVTGLDTCIDHWDYIGEAESLSVVVSGPYPTVEDAEKILVMFREKYRLQIRGKKASVNFWGVFDAKYKEFVSGRKTNATLVENGDFTQLVKDLLLDPPSDEHEEVLAKIFPIDYHSRRGERKGKKFDF